MRSLSQCRQRGGGRDEIFDPMSRRADQPVVEEAGVTMFTNLIFLYSALPLEIDEPVTPSPTKVGFEESRTSHTAPTEARAVCEAGRRPARSMTEPGPSQT